MSAADLIDLAIARQAACHVCLDDGELVGHVTAFGQRGIWWVQSLCVAEKYRRSGFGRQLLKRTMRDVPRGRSAQAFVLERNGVGLEFFAACGFRVLKLMPSFAGDEDGDRRVLMVRRR